PTEIAREREAFRSAGPPEPRGCPHRRCRSHRIARPPRRRDHVQTSAPSFRPTACSWPSKRETHSRPWMKPNATLFGANATESTSEGAQGIDAPRTPAHAPLFDDNDMAVADGDPEAGRRPPRRTNWAGGRQGAIRLGPVRPARRAEHHWRR